MVAAVLLLVALPHIAVTARRRPARARPVARRWVERGLRLTGVGVQVRGLRPDPASPAVLVANHSSPLDIPALLLACPDARFVAGADLFRVPLLAGAMRALGTVAVDRGGGGAHLDIPGTGGPLVVFPEGGIAPAGTRRPFKRGAFAAAIERQWPVVPVAISGTSRVLPPRGRLGVAAGTVTVEFLPPLATAGLGGQDRHRLCSDAEERILAALEVADGGRADRHPDEASPEHVRI